MSNAEKDPYQEPENSTVDDWQGQEVAADAERIDEVLEETGGDVEAAEETFEEESPRSERDTDDAHRA